MNNAKQTKIIYACIGLFFVVVAGAVMATFMGGDTPVVPPPVKPASTVKNEKKESKPAEEKIDIGGMFGSDKPKAPPVVEKVVEKAPPPPQKKPFVLRLKGSIISDKPYAFIINTQNSEEYVKLIGDEVVDGWKLIHLEEEFAVVRKGQQKVRMGVDGSISDISPKGAKREYDVPELTSSDKEDDLASTWFYRSPEDIKKRLSQLKNPAPDSDFDKKSPTRFVINRSTFRKLRANMMTYGRDWVIAPLLSKDKKKLEGVKIYGVNRFSLPYSYGARPGDIIKKINDTEINSPLSIFKLVSFYKDLVNDPKEAHYKVIVERLGKPVTFTFIIRGN